MCACTDAHVCIGVYPHVLSEARQSYAIAFCLIPSGLPLSLVLGLQSADSSDPHVSAPNSAGVTDVCIATPRLFFFNAAAKDLNSDPRVHSKC